MTASRSKSQSRPGGVLVTAGEFYLDLIFYDLPHPPRMGQELKTDNFLFSPGGGAAITAAAAARLGRPAVLATVCGDSPLDLAARTMLDELGIELRASRVQPDAMSGLTVAVSTRVDRYFVTHPGANRYLDAFLLSEEGRRGLREAAHVHFALAAEAWEPFCELVEELQDAGVTTSWDMGWDPEAADAPGFRTLCSRLDVLFLNEIEALRYTGADTPQEAIQRLSHSRNTVVVKLGKQGAVASDRSGPLETADAIEVEAVETTGAGDAFNGGFLNAWMEQESLSRCLRAGNICGGLSTRAAGGVGALPTWEEFRSKLDG